MSDEKIQTGAGGHPWLKILRAKGLNPCSINRDQFKALLIESLYCYAGVVPYFQKEEGWYFLGEEKRDGRDEGHPPEKTEDEMILTLLSKILRPDWRKLDLSGDADRKNPNHPPMWSIIKKSL